MYLQKLTNCDTWRIQTILHGHPRYGGLVRFVFHAPLKGPGIILGKTRRKKFFIYAINELFSTKKYSIRIIHLQTKHIFTYTILYIYPLKRNRKPLTLLTNFSSFIFIVSHFTSLITIVFNRVTNFLG